MARLNQARAWRVVVVVGILLLGLVPQQASLADDAVVLPKGTSRLFVDTHFYIPFDNRYDSDGNSVPYAKPFNTSLNSVLIPSLAPLNGFVPGGVASFGQSNASAQRNLTEMIFQPAYGITDRFSLGVNIPYYEYRNEVNASVNSSPGSGANVGFSTVASPFGPAGSVVPLALVPSTRATTQDIQNLLGKQFGIKPIQTWDESGIGDIEVGGRYQYYRGEDLRAAFTGGVRLPTGKVDDPDNLVDTPFGKGAYALLFQFQQDYMHQKDGLGKRLGFPDPAEWFINTTFRYDLNLPTNETLRVCPGGGPFCNTKDNVDIKYGDQIQAEVSGKLGLFIPGLNFSPLYQYTFKFKDHYSGDKGLDYGSLNQQLDNSRGQVQQQIYILQLTYSTLPIFIQKQFPFPLVVQVSYRDRFAGQGGTPDSRYIGFTVQAFF